MRHHNNNRKFGRPTNQRRALLRSLAENLILHGHLTTTEARAKEVQKFVEKLITIARPADLASRRQLIKRLGRPTQVKRLVNEIAPRYKERPGGYTRVIKLPRRPSDGSRMAVISLLE